MKEHETASAALAAKSEDVARRAQRLATERAEYRKEKTTLEAAQAVLQRDLVELREREATAEALRAEYEGRLTKLKSALSVDE